MGLPVALAQAAPSNIWRPALWKASPSDSRCATSRKGKIPGQFGEEAAIFKFPKASYLYKQLSEY